MSQIKSIEELVLLMRQGTSLLKSMSNNLDFPWTPENDDPRKLHNMYARNLVTCYVSKYSELSEAIITSWENNSYMSYALAGRSLIEITATLRYYTIHKYKPLLGKGELSLNDMNDLIQLDDRHLRGARFDWESFLEKRYEKLIEGTKNQISKNKEKQKEISGKILAEQVNVLTCIEKWAKETPEVLVAYNLFCDLVHPNIGSSFLVASTNERGIFFTPAKGKSVGKDIFEQSLPLLLSITHQKFSEYLILLIGTIWQYDELSNA